MTIRGLLRSIDARLARLERSVQVGQCCPTLPDGSQVPILIPRETPTQVPPEGDGGCLLIGKALRKTVWTYNGTIMQLKPDWNQFINGAAIIEAALFQLTAAAQMYLTRANAERFLEAISESSIDALLIDDEGIDWCEAVRQYVAGDDPPDELTRTSSPAARIAFTIWYGFIGGIAWGPAINSDLLPDVPGVDQQCCYPDSFALVPTAVTLVCGNDSYSIQAVTDVVPYVTGVLVAPGAVSRSALAGRYLQSVEPFGSFSLRAWYSSTPELSVSCRSVDVVLSAGVSWRVMSSGAAFLVIRNITDYEGTYLVCTREPQFPNNVEEL